jgi:hypothetical protein
MYHETRWAQEASPLWQRLIPAPVWASMGYGYKHLMGKLLMQV